MQYRALNPSYYQYYQRNLWWLFGLGFGALFGSILFLEADRFFRSFGVACILLLYVVVNFPHWFFPKTMLRVTADCVSLDEKSLGWTPAEVETIKVKITGYKGEVAFSSRFGLPGTGFENTITIILADREVTTRFLLRDPNQEKALVTVLTRYYGAEVVRYV